MLREHLLSLIDDYGKVLIINLIRKNMASEYKLTKALVSSLNFAKSVYENDDFDDITLLE